MLLFNRSFVGNARMQTIRPRAMMHTSRLHAVQTSQALSSETAERVLVFTTPGCQYCRKAKQTLTDLQVPYKEVNVSVSADLRQALRNATGERTVPQVFVNGRLVGGSDRLATKVNDGSFAQLLDDTQSQHSLPEALQQALKSVAAAQAEPGAGSPAGPQLAPELQALATKLAEPQTGIARADQPGTHVQWHSRESLLLTGSNSRAAAQEIAKQQSRLLGSCWQPTL